MTKPNKLPSQAKLREDFTYNSETGDFTRYDGYWGFIAKTGYCQIGYEGVIYLIHRLIWKYMTNEDPDEIDHINGDKTDNRWYNLRNVNRKTNNRNTKKRSDNKSGFNGVYWEENRNKWTALVGIDSKQIRIGTYDTPQEAADARREFIAEFMPFVFSDRHGE